MLLVTMILIITAVIILMLVLVGIFNKKLSEDYPEIKYEIMYGYIGFLSILEDVWKIGKNKTDLPEKTGSVVVITGGLRGIGLEVIRLLLDCDMTIVVGCRDVEKGEHLYIKMRQEGIHTGKLDFKKLDVSSLESVRKFATSVKKDYPIINVLINNAGIMYVPYAETSEGYESQFATNYLGHFLLTHLLLNNLKAAGTEEEYARIVNISSIAHTVAEIDFDDINSNKRYIAFKAYGQSKLAVLLFSIHLDEILKKSNSFVESYAVHPGIVNTGLFNDTFVKKISPFVLNVFCKPPEKGAIPIVFCAISPKAKGLGGKYISNCEVKSTNATSDEEANLRKELFKFTLNLLKIKEFGKI